MKTKNPQIILHPQTAGNKVSKMIKESQMVFNQLSHSQLQIKMIILTIIVSREIVLSTNNKKISLLHLWMLI